MTARRDIPHTQRAVVALIVTAVGAWYLARASLLAAAHTGRPAAPERLVAALMGPGERLAYRLLARAHARALASFRPRALAVEAEQLAMRVDEALRAASALNETTQEAPPLPEFVSDAAALTSALADALPATVIGADPTGRRPLVQLDRGARHQVVRGLGLVCGPDLIGRIERVNRSTSVAILATDREFAVAVRCLRSNHYVGVAEGDGSRLLTVRRALAAADAREGDVLVTAGEYPRIPIGVRVGVVERVQSVPPELLSVDEGASADDTQLSLSLVVSPVADLRRLDEVGILGARPPD